MPNRQKLHAWWKSVAPGLRRALGYTVPTLAEAEEEMADAGVAEVPMTENEIDRIVEFATGKRKD